MPTYAAIIDKADAVAAVYTLNRCRSWSFLYNRAAGIALIMEALSYKENICRSCRLY
jgi:hypothetical protein